MINEIREPEELLSTEHAVLKITRNLNDLNVQQRTLCLVAGRPDQSKYSVVVRIFSQGVKIHTNKNCIRSISNKTSSKQERSTSTASYTFLLGNQSTIRKQIRVVLVSFNENKQYILYRRNG